MALGPNLRVVKGDGGSPKKNDQPRGVESAQAAMRRFLASSGSRSQLPEALVQKLDSLRASGTNFFDLLKPYHHASVFDFEFARRYSWSGGVSEEALKLMRDVLDRTANEFMGERFVVFSSPKQQRQRDLESTSVIAAFFFVAAVSRYVPEIIFETPGAAASKQEEAECFVKFFDERLAGFMDLSRKWENPRALYEASYKSYLEFQEQFPQILNQLRNKLAMTPTAQLMAPYGDDRFTIQWRAFHYRGAL